MVTKWNPAYPPGIPQEPLWTNQDSPRRAPHGRAHRRQLPGSPAGPSVPNAQPPTPGTKKTAAAATLFRRPPTQNQQAFQVTPQNMNDVLLILFAFLFKPTSMGVLSKTITSMFSRWPKQIQTALFTTNTVLPKSD